MSQRSNRASPASKPVLLNSRATWKRRALLVGDFSRSTAKHTRNTDTKSSVFLHLFLQSSLVIKQVHSNHFPEHDFPSLLIPPTKIPSFAPFRRIKIVCSSFWGLFFFLNKVRRICLAPELGLDGNYKTERASLVSFIIITLILCYVSSFCLLDLSIELRLTMVRLWLLLGDKFVRGGSGRW